MGTEDESAVLAFNAAINSRDLEALGLLMSSQHRFIDSAGSAINGKLACLEAWRDFFEAFPDYRNVFESLQSRDGGVVEVLGHSECSVPDLAGPARWRVLVKDGLLAEWQVFDL
jgi:ketosteroid isomerase-like protein